MGLVPVTMTSRKDLYGGFLFPRYEINEIMNSK